MKKGTGTELFDRNNLEIRMGDKLKLFDSDGRVHTIKVGYDFGMFVEEGTSHSLYSIISAYEKFNGGEDVEIVDRRKRN